jgi:hypothetical protein
MFAPLLYKVDAMDGHLSKRDAVQRVAGQWDERDGRRDET